MRTASGALLAAGLITTALSLPATAATNQPPLAPTGLAVNGTACSGTIMWEPDDTTLALTATITDPDGDNVSGQFQWWPVDNPGQVTEIDSGYQPSGIVNRENLAESQLTDGATYAWQVRGEDTAGNLGSWSTTCEFTTDFTAPSVAPTVSSTDYPENADDGGTGVPGTFTFGANGISDVVRFDYGFIDPSQHHVAADQLGGSATVELTPTAAGPTDLYVRSVDRAGNFSPIYRYHFYVTDNIPRVSCTPALAGPEVPRQCTLSPEGNTTVVDYRYSFNGSTETAITPGADGTATVTVTPTDYAWLNTLAVRADLTGGVLTSYNNYSVTTTDAAPNVTTSTDEGTVGVPVTFTFQSDLTKLVSYTYEWNYGDPVTVAAGSDGTASVTFTPDQSGWNELDVWATNADGIQSGVTNSGVDVQAAGS